MNFFKFMYIDMIIHVYALCITSMCMELSLIEVISLVY